MNIFRSTAIARAPQAFSKLDWSVPSRSMQRVSPVAGKRDGNQCGGRRAQDGGLAFPVLSREKPNVARVRFQKRDKRDRRDTEPVSSTHRNQAC
ncbi:hypothetical protein Nepgr_017565 [Nepenthes gracilis]|uniref:Uncharacterized protein n=1 Tax=Nepenthes gracilis TaxID=150966 RepID=A0AAD3SRT0_NEPGR|nr:hypothetical protein Nepgr_017565 [Nepenthes gracilis]